MTDLKDFLMWLVATILAANLVGSQVEMLISISSEEAGLLASVFLSLCLGSLLFMTISVIHRFCEGVETTRYLCFLLILFSKLSSWSQSERLSKSCQSKIHVVASGNPDI